MRKFWICNPKRNFTSDPNKDLFTSVTIISREAWLETNDMCIPPDYSANKMFRIWQDKHDQYSAIEWGVCSVDLTHTMLRQCWLQQPGKWTYNPMSKSATNEELWGDLIQILLVITDSQQADCTNLGNELTIPCLSQQPHNHMHTYIANALHITYPMAYFKMAYQIHVQRPISRWSIYF